MHLSSQKIIIVELNFPKKNQVLSKILYFRPSKFYSHKMKKYLLVLLLGVAFLSCDKNDNFIPFFSVADDKALGLQVSQEIANDPSFTLLDDTEYPEAYEYLENITTNILNSGEVAYKDEFEWKVTIVQDDSTLNAFATPGGYIYVYTGLIKYLESVDALAGVMGHEIAHADLRHTSRNLQKQYGVSILLSVVLGNDAGQLQQIAGQVAGTVAGLAFSREFETEADLRSVEYLAQTGYACDGAKIFFESLEASGQGGGTPEFLSTHPNPDNRVENISEKADEEDCDTALSGDNGYDDFQESLP